MKRRIFLIIIISIIFGVIYYSFFNNKLPNNERGDRISYHSSSLSVDGVDALPSLFNDPSVWVWSTHNEESLFFHVKKEDRQVFEIFLADLDNPETFYQLMIDPLSDEITAFKYVGGLWRINEDNVSRTALHRVIWEEIGEVIINIKGNNIDITIPWSSIRGITPKDKIGIQITEGPESERAWDSRDERTSFLDRRTWNQLFLK